MITKTEIYKDIYGPNPFVTGLETLLPLEICHTIWEKNKRYEFQNRIKKFDKCLFIRKPSMELCRFGCFQVEMKCGFFEVAHPTGRSKNRRRRFVHKNGIFYY